jgi:hypothetical protein
MGYSSWGDLAKTVHNELLKADRVRDFNGYNKFLASRKYPELLRQAELDLGGKPELCALVGRALLPRVRVQGRAYEYLVKWPFACYLTTNFDDELATQLKQAGTFYQTVRNRPEDMALVARDGATGFVVKLHSDLDHPDEAVLTSVDYSRLYVDNEGAYFRDRLSQMFGFFSILIIGHSLSDPDVSHALALAKRLASPEHPVFMIAADLTVADQRDLREKYNIEAVSYHDGTQGHKGLISLLASANRFVTPRRELAIATATPPSEDEVNAASYVFIFRNLRRARRVDEAARLGLVSPLVLQAVAKAGHAGARQSDIASQGMLVHFSNACGRGAASFDDTLRGLEQAGLLHRESDVFKLTADGAELLCETQATKSAERERAMGQFGLDLKRWVPRIGDAEAQVCVGMLESAVTGVFRSRGLVVVQAIFDRRSPSRDELIDVFACVSATAAGIADGEVRAAFVEAAFRFLTEPTEAQREYLASLSQGYFMYHWLGLDPTCGSARQSFFREAMWICDTSVVLPLLADGCANHEYAVDFMRRLRGQGARLYTTDRLIQEAWEHLVWARNFVHNHPVESPEFLAAATRKGSYSPNVFIDGYIRASAKGGVGSFEQYLKTVCPSCRSKPDFSRHVRQLGFDVLKLERLSGFCPEDTAKAACYECDIRDYRREKTTLRSDLQVQAEAEVLRIVLGLRDGSLTIPDSTQNLSNVYFVSQSRVLDHVGEGNEVISMTPESVYRYLVSLSLDTASPQLLQQCMVGEYYHAGISFVDSRLYAKFFRPLIDASRLSLREQLRQSAEDFDRAERARLGAAFDSTPDLEKPFFVLNLGWRAYERAAKRQLSAERESARDRKRADEAEEAQKAMMRRGVPDIKDIKKERRRLEQLTNTLRNLQNPELVQKLARERRRRERRRRLERR